MTQSDIINYLINTNDVLKGTYEMYQNILHAIKNNKINELELSLNNKELKISDYMKTSIKTLKEYLPYIKNTLLNPYDNGFVESNNNFIKVLKRIALGFRSFIDLKQEL